MSVRLSRAAYAKKYGPTVGDRIRLADSELIIEIEKDYIHYGEESIFGGGKSIRDGQDQCALQEPMKGISASGTAGSWPSADRGIPILKKGSTLGW